MKVKVFDMPCGIKVMVLDTEEFVEYYLQIDSSNWHFCCGCKEDFDKVTKEDAELILDQYYEYVDEDEKVLEKHADQTLGYWEKFKKVVGYGFNDFEGECYTSYVFNIDDETNIGHMPVKKEYLGLFNDKRFVKYFLDKVSKGYCNETKKKAIKLISIEDHPWKEDSLRISVEFV